MTPQKLHLSAAVLEMFTWTLLLVGMALKYSGVTEAVVPVAGSIHGFGFLSFLFMTCLIWINNRWPLGIGVLGLAVSAIPFAALPFALWTARRGLVAGGWRYRDTDSAATPAGPADALLVQVVRHPVRSILLAVVVIAIVFGVLVRLGPPVDVEGIISGS